MKKTFSKKKLSKLPEFFKPLFWSYDFSLIDPQKDRERIVVNTINYGDWQHWQWIVNHYGKEEIKRILENVPASEFRKRALKLISLLLKIEKTKYASRGTKIRAERNIS